MIVKKVYLTKNEPVKFDLPQGSAGVQFGIRLQDYTIPGSATANVYVYKPDGTLIFNSAEIEDNTVIITTTTQMTAVRGIANAQVQITATGIVLRTFTFILEIQKSIIDESAIESTDEFSALQAALQQVDDFATKTSLASKGSSSRPVYFNASGAPVAIDAVGLSYGGTGATSAAGARTALNIPDLDDLKSKGSATSPVYFNASGVPVPVDIPIGLSSGGTGVTTLADLKTLLSLSDLFHPLDVTGITNANNISGSGWVALNSTQAGNMTNLPATVACWFVQFQDGVYKLNFYSPMSQAEGYMNIKWRKCGSSSTWNEWRNL